MSCGNRFSCGIKRFQKHQFAPDRPTNQELHQENENRLSELLRLREEQDKNLSFTPPTKTTLPISTITTSTTPNETNFTPWKTPSTN